MIRYVIFSFLLIFSFGVKGQEWFPVGASWYYNQVILLEGNSYQHFEVLGETVIQGKNCKIVSGYCQCSQYQALNYLYQDGDKIYVFESAADSFKLLYDFSLMPGDTITHYSESTGDSHFLLDSVTNWTVGQETLRVQHLTWLDGWAVLGTTIYERVGSNACLYPIIGFCDPGTGPLRCYEDNETGLLQFDEPEKPCDYVSATSEIESTHLNVYPNPAMDVIHIEADDQIQSVELIELQTGISVVSKNADAKRIQIETGKAVNGAYVLRVMMADKSIVMRKVIVI